MQVLYVCFFVFKFLDNTCILKLYLMKVLCKVMHTGQILPDLTIIKNNLPPII